MNIVEPGDTIPVPESLATCPICGAPIAVVDIEEWEADTGRIVHFVVDCTTAPDIDSDDWPDWQRHHWSTPYVDWLPLERPILRWLSANYRVRAGGAR